MSPTIQERVAAARAGANPAVICRMPSGWAVLCDMQFLRGYAILLPDPVVESLNDLTNAQRAAYLCDMALIGDALMEVTGAFRINYAILGNSDPALHAHIVPRYLDEPDDLRRGLPWDHPHAPGVGMFFDYERDRELILQLAGAIRKRL
jgi:diadenosine tetraphosphate (Ap4A) HIT family hydrolase